MKSARLRKILILTLMIKTIVMLGLFLDVVFIYYDIVLINFNIFQTISFISNTHKATLSSGSELLSPTIFPLRPTNHGTPVDLSFDYAPGCAFGLFLYSYTNLGFHVP